MRPLYLKADAGKIPELKRVIVGYEDSIAMERTLEEALQKIFGGLMGKESKEVERMVGEKLEFPETQSPGDEKVVLRQSDYMKIKTIFDRVIASQGELDQTLSNYKKDLQSLVEIFGEAEKKEMQKNHATETQGIGSE